MSTTSPIPSKPLGLVLPNFARNKLAAITSTPTTSSIIAVPTKQPVPIIVPFATNGKQHIAKPSPPSVQNHVTLLIPKAQPTVIQPAIQVPQISSPRVPTVVRPCSPQLITPRLSPSRPLISSSSMSAVSIPRLQTPRISVTNNTSIPVDNPWLPTKSDNNSLMIKVAAMTPIGTIALVPTADKRPTTPSRSSITRVAPTTPTRTTPGRSITLKVIEEQDPLINATIYLDVSGHDERGYTYVADHMRSIAATTSDLQNRYATQYRALPMVQGRVIAAQFEELLNIYENNQVFYQDRLDDKQISLANIEQGLTQLEYWFMRIIEPVPRTDVESWKDREQTKILKGYSAYCDPELHKYIVPAPTSLRNEIQLYQAR